MSLLDGASISTNNCTQATSGRKGHLKNAHRKLNGSVSQQLVLGYVSHSTKGIARDVKEGGLMWSLQLVEVDPLSWSGGQCQ